MSLMVSASNLVNDLFGHRDGFAAQLRPGRIPKKLRSGSEGCTEVRHLRLSQQRRHALRHVADLWICWHTESAGYRPARGNWGDTFDGCGTGSHVGGVGFQALGGPAALLVSRRVPGRPHRGDHLPIRCLQRRRRLLAGACLASVWAVLLTPRTVGFGPMAVAVAILGGITATWGNLVALHQTNIKRLLAYSSIRHAGYMILAAAC